MLKKVLAATAMLAIAGSSFVYAQQRAGGPDGPGGRDRDADRRPRAERYQPTADDMSAFADARIAAIKAGLKLTPDQEKNWPAFESGYRNLAKLRADRTAARREARRLRHEGGAQNRGEARDQSRDRDDTGSMVERMQRRADAMTRNAAALKQFADAAVPLYQSLDDAQKHRFGFLTRFMYRQRPMRFADNEERGRFEQDGPGRFERWHSRRFGAADGTDDNRLAADRGTGQDRNGRPDRDDD